MRCTHGRLAEDCGADHWCPAFGGRKEPASWRAACPCCHLDRVLSWWPASDWRTDWRCHCPCQRAAVQARISELLPCFSAGGKPKRIKADDAIELALSSANGLSLKLALMELAGMSTPDALDKLGVRREHRARVIDGRAPFLVQNRRS